MPARRLTRLTLLAAITAALVALQTPAAHAKVRSAVSGELLVVTGGKGSDRVTVACVAGLVKVNGKDPAGGAVACSKISEVDVLPGPGDDRVDFSGVGSASGFGVRDLPGFGQGTGAAADLGTGNDRYIGGRSAFNLVLAGEGDDRISGGALRDSLQMGAGNDTAAAGSGRDLLLGNAGRDKLNGGADDDLLSGNAGDDLLIGGAGTDLLGGGAGMDRLFGGPGPDQLVGGKGKDKLNGGPGSNTLIQNSPTKK